MLIELSRKSGVTIFVSTHFMNEAARCDRISLMDAGRVLATDTPENLVRARHAASLEEAFISYLEEADGTRGRAPDKGVSFDAQLKSARATDKTQVSSIFSLRRMLAYTIRELRELSRDPIRLGFALLGTAFLMLIFGFGITTDVDLLSFAALDRDDSFESRAYLSELRGSRYFVEQAPLKDAADLQNRLKSGKVTATVEIPPGFGRDIKRGRPTEVGVWIDGAMPFRAETIYGYMQGVHQQFLSDPAIRGHAGLTSTALPHRDRHISGDDCPNHATARLALHAGGYAAQLAVGRQHAARKHAACLAHDHAGLAIDALRVFRAGDPLPWRRHRCRLAQISCCGSDRRSFLALGAYPLPKHLIIRDVSWAQRAPSARKRQPIALRWSCSAKRSLRRMSSVAPTSN